MRRMALPLVLATGFLIAAFNVLGQEQVPAPTFHDGDFWQFKVREYDYIGRSSDELNGIYELSYSQGKVRTSELAGDQKVDMGRRPSSLLALLGLSEDPRYRDLEFPLSVGKKWNYTYRARLRGERIPFLRSVEISVVGIEQITTAAGTFSAFKLVKEDWSGPQSRWITTYFYSPETRSVVKSLYDSSVGSGSGGKREIELVKFGSAR